MNSPPGPESVLTRQGRRLTEAPDTRGLMEWDSGAAILLGRARWFAHDRGHRVFGGPHLVAAALVVGEVHDSLAPRELRTNPLLAGILLGDPVYSTPGASDEATEVTAAFGRGDSAMGPLPDRDIERILYRAGRRASYANRQLITGADLLIATWTTPGRHSRAVLPDLWYDRQVLTALDPVSEIDHLRVASLRFAERMIDSIDAVGEAASTYAGKVLDPAPPEDPAGSSTRQWWRSAADLARRTVGRFLRWVEHRRRVCEDGGSSFASAPIVALVLLPGLLVREGVRVTLSYLVGSTPPLPDVRNLVEPGEPTRPFAPRRRALVMMVPHVVVFVLGAVYIAPIIVGHQLLGVQAFPSTRLLDGVDGSQTASWLLAALMLDGEIVGSAGRWTALAGLFAALPPHSLIRDVRWALAGGSWRLRTLGILLAPLHALSGLLSVFHPAVRIVLGGLLVSVVGVTLLQATVALLGGII